MKASKRTIPDRARHGYSTMEYLVATAMLASVLSFLIPILLKTASVSDGINQREIALRELNNVIARLHSGQSNPTISEAAHRHLQNAELTIEELETDDDAMVSVVAEISWDHSPATKRSSVALTYWTLAKETE